MKHKTAELTGALLDQAVCIALGYASDEAIPEEVIGSEYHPFESGRYPWRPSENWAQGGPIVERESIELRKTGGYWSAMGDGFYAEGPTPLVAAMRAYVALKQGDEVDV